MASQPENITFSFPKSAIPCMIGASLLLIALLAFALTRLLDDEIDAQIEYRPGVRWNMPMNEVFKMETAREPAPFHRNIMPLYYNTLYFGPYRYFDAECVVRYRFTGDDLRELDFTFRFDTLEETQAVAERVAFDLADKYGQYLDRTSLRPSYNEYKKRYILPNTFVSLYFKNKREEDGFYYLELSFSGGR